MRFALASVAVTAIACLAIYLFDAAGMWLTSFMV